MGKNRLNECSWDEGCRKRKVTWKEIIDESLIENGVLFWDYNNCKENEF